jgi:dihydrofolate reductase
MKARAERDLTVGGPDLAAQAIKAGLVDECHLFLTLIMVGGGKPSLPNDVRLKLELLDERRFGNGVVHLHYSAKCHLIRRDPQIPKIVERLQIGLVSC